MVLLSHGSGRARCWMLASGVTQRAWNEKNTRKTPVQRRKPPDSASREENKKDNVLDEAFLMKHHHLKNPSDLCSVNISNQNLVSAKEDDFEKFNNLASINAAENLLKLESFRKFPGLWELELSLNGLRNVKITPGDFLHLEHLDLSYNNLSPQDVWTLGYLSQLKVLHLTANGLWSLPPDLAGSYGSAHLRFPSLEVLSLDENHLSDPSIFVSLAHLCSLRELNLDRNRISAVPYLHQVESRQLLLHPSLDGDSFRAKWYKSLRSLWHQWQPPQQDDMEMPAEQEAKKGQPEYVMLQNKRDLDGKGQLSPLDVLAGVVPREMDPSASTALAAPSMLRNIRAPFPELKHLSLAFNKIADETALLPVAFFPCLKELTFHNNPLTTTRSGTCSAGEREENTKARPVESMIRNGEEKVPPVSGDTWRVSITVSTQDHHIPVPPIGRGHLAGPHCGATRDCHIPVPPTGGDTPLVSIMAPCETSQFHPSVGDVAPPETVASDGH
ncbi:X-ray radiation resistance-associated protein 1 [Porphyrio hochstetteri]